MNTNPPTTEELAALYRQTGDIKARLLLGEKLETEGCVSWME